MSTATASCASMMFLFGGAAGHADPSDNPAAPVPYVSVLKQRQPGSQRGPSTEDAPQHHTSHPLEDDSSAAREACQVGTRWSFESASSLSLRGRACPTSSTDMPDVAIRIGSCRSDFQGVAG